MDNQKTTDMENQNYEYQDNALVIKLQTSDPAALHESLMKGLTHSIKNQIFSEQKSDSQLVLVDLLETLIPNEITLSRK